MFLGMHSSSQGTLLQPEPGHSTLAAVATFLLRLKGDVVNNADVVIHYELAENVCGYFL